MELTLPSPLAPLPVHSVPYEALPKKAELDALVAFATAAQKQYAAVVVLGIGGSSLPPRALVAAVQPQGGLPVHYIDTLDPDGVMGVLSKVPMKKTLFVVSSKSGTTLETLAVFAVVQELLGDAWKRQVVIITDAKQGQLRVLAERERLPSFAVPESVGGRFSVFTPVGLLPAALAGVDIRAVVRGAGEASSEQAGRLAAFQKEAHEKGRRIAVFFPYRAAFRMLGDWYTQLLAESSGKSARVGLTPMVAVGPTDQHSALQLFMEGPNDKHYVVLSAEKYTQSLRVPRGKEYFSGKTFAELLSAQMLGTVSALREKKRPVAEILLRDSSARSVGCLLYTLMLSVSALCEGLGVNPYDQPGVERGKVLTRELLTRKK